MKCHQNFVKNWYFGFKKILELNGRELPNRIAKTTLSFIVGAIFCSCAYHTPPPSPLSDNEGQAVVFFEGENPYAKLFFHENIPILIYKTCDPYQSGYGVGLLLAPQILTLQTGYIKPLMKKLDAAPPSCIKGRDYDANALSYLEKFWSERLKPLLVYNLDLASGNAHQHLLERAKQLEIPEAFLIEMQGIVDGVNDYFSYRNDSKPLLTLEDLIVSHLFLDSFKRMGMVGVESSFGCCAIAVVGSCGTFLGRNLDWPNQKGDPEIKIGEYSLVTVRRGKRGANKVVSIGFPGMVGTLTGMNEKGVCAAVCESGGSIASQGMPYMFAVRSLLGSVSSVQEAEMFMRATPCASSFNLTLVDFHQAATFQIDPQAASPVEILMLDKEMIHATNHFIVNATEEVVPNTVSDSSSVRRYQAIQSTFNALNQQPCYEERIKQCLHCACQRNTIQAVLMHPQKKTMKVAFRSGWSALRENADYVEINCRLLFDKAH